jgi:spermidine synthase
MKLRARLILGFCFFISGATSLILQVAWSKELSYILGTTLYAVATVVAAFMAGLGIGSALASRLAERFSEPVRAYAYLQVGIGICGAFSIPVFRGTEPIFRFLFQTLGPQQSAFLIARFSLTFALMLVPVTMMGMTLPILVGAYARSKEKYGFDAGMIYGINTLGAVTGTWLAGFLLIPTLGLLKSCVLVGLTDALLGAVALWVNRGVGTIDDIRRTHRKSRTSPPWTRTQWTIGTVFAVSGAAAMVYEVGWFRLLGLTMGPSVYTFSVILGMFLLGVGIGSTAAARWAERTRLGGMAGMAALESVLGLAGLAGILYYNRLPQLNYDVFLKATDSLGNVGFFLGQMVIAAVVVLPACVVMGALFPMAVRAVRESGRMENAPEANVGRLYVMNTFGGIVGSLAAGFLVIPQMGAWKTLLSAALISTALAFALLALSRHLSWLTRATWAVGLAGVASLALIVPPWNVALFNQGLYREVYTARRLDLERTNHDQLVYYSEGINAPVAVFNVGGSGILRVAGKADASTLPADFYTQLFVGHLPVMFAESPRRAALIGYGSGMSAMSMLTHPEVESLDIIEIEQAVMNASPYFESINLDPLKDSRTHLVLDDARVYLTHSGKTYDVITSEPSNPWMAGISNLFTADFYRIVRERLSPDGVFGQWIQIYEMSEETFRVILASIHDVFPHVVVFRPAVGDAMVLASMRPIQLPWQTFASRFSGERALASFARVNLSNPLQMFFHFYASEDAVNTFIGSTKLRNTDDNVWLEYRMPRNMLQTSSSQGSQEESIGITLLKSDPDRRLEAFQRMLPGVPRDAVVRETLAYQYGMELDVGLMGILDPWTTARGLMADELRSEILRSDSALIPAFERWVKDGETHMRNQTASIQTLISTDDPTAIHEVVNAMPDLPIAQISMANALFLQGNLQAAEMWYRNALGRPSSKGYYDALIGLGTIALRRGFRDQAQDFYQRAIQHNPYQPVAFRNLALMLRGNDAVQLRSVVERGLAFNPNDAQLRAMLP